MAETSLAIAGASTMLVALTYGYVGLRLARQARMAGGPRKAMALFAMWWLATSLNQLLGSALYLAAAFGSTNVDVQLAYVHLQRLLLALSLVGLMYYLIYLQTGRDLLVPIAIVYALYFASQVYMLSLRTPTGVESFGWRTDLTYATQLSRLWEVVGLVIVVPPVIGALMMLRVYRRVGTPTRRFRVAMLGVGFVAWWILAILAGQRAAFDVTGLQILNRVVGVAVAIGILFAYEPLPWMQRRYHLEPFSARTS